DTLPNWDSRIVARIWSRMQMIPWSPDGSPYTQPSAGSQLSGVQSTKSLQTGGVPALQMPVPGSQVSSPSQASPLSQAFGVPTHTPAAQTSVVQASLSVQAFRSFAVEV